MLERDSAAFEFNPSLIDQTRARVKGVLIRSFVKAFQQLDDLAIQPWIEHTKGFFNKTFIKEIFLDVTLNYGIEVILVPAQGAGCMIDMNRARQMICNGIFFRHGSV